MLTVVPIRSLILGFDFIEDGVGYRKILPKISDSIHFNLVLKLQKLTDIKNHLFSMKTYQFALSLCGFTDEHYVG